MVGRRADAVDEVGKASDQIDLPAIIQALEFEAPYVVERLVNDRVADTEAEGMSCSTSARGTSCSRSRKQTSSSECPRPGG